MVRKGKGESRPWEMRSGLACRGGHSPCGNWKRESNLVCQACEKAALQGGWSRSRRENYERAFGWSESVPDLRLRLRLGGDDSDVCTGNELRRDARAGGSAANLRSFLASDRRGAASRPDAVCVMPYKDGISSSRCRTLLSWAGRSVWSSEPLQLH